MGRISWLRTRQAGGVGTVPIDSIELSTDQECRAFTRTVFRKGCQAVEKEKGQGIHVDPLIDRPVAPRRFVIAGEDRHVYPAKVEAVDVGKFAASSPFVENPVAVRYAWGVYPGGNFGNRAGPAAPFRTDDWPCWVDRDYGRAESPTDPDPAQVPTSDEAKRQAWERKAAQARAVLEEYDAWKEVHDP